MDPTALTVAVVAASVAAFAWIGWRQWVVSRPLRLASIAVREESTVRVRARLGYGRLVLTTDVDAWWDGPDGRVALRPYLPAVRRIGAWTITMPGVPLEGALHLRLTAHEPGRSWTVEHSWGPASIVEGRFEPLLVRERGEWAWSRGWDQRSNLLLADDQPGQPTGRRPG